MGSISDSKLLHYYRVNARHLAFFDVDILLVQKKLKTRDKKLTFYLFRMRLSGPTNTFVSIIYTKD